MHKYMYTNKAIEFAWDEEKRLRTLHERGLDFAQAYKVFEGPTFTFEDNRFDYEEQRFVTLGLLNNVVVIVHTETEQEIRIIFMRKANKHEQELYFKNLYR
ncbi:MAG: hypothetical protein MAG431_02297 [Chloroflexi bacterium]|nr:hypothetical protein [Chloroflexota bacterium]